ncbi:rRNA maturation RNase YbeY [Flavobacteriales bacterium]|jgi:probable rRNA maturation factor|nr:rRNA maturation RNase YbeY [Flavobacteriales bacterium]|tara:strand:- start:721 stop:1152 length:432 start_codon:yes stop_codon:yes gene_type:complete
MDIQSEFDFRSEDILFQLNEKPAIISWLSYSITAENKIPGDISYVFCSDDFLHKMNVKYLNHNTLTDIITFDYCHGNLINGEMFISIDRIKDNAKDFSVSLDKELHRVMIHGIMHLCGYNDKTVEDQNVMSSKEDFYLNLREF